MGWPNTFLVSALLAFLAGAVSGLATWKRAAAARLVAFGFAVLGSLLLLVAACSALSLPTSATASLPLVTIFPCTVRLDPLSAWFTLALALLALAVSVYSIEYLRPVEGTRNLGALGFFYNALLLGLALVFTAANALMRLVPSCGTRWFSASILRERTSGSFASCHLPAELASTASVLLLKP